MEYDPNELDLNGVDIKRLVKNLSRKEWRKCPATRDWERKYHNNYRRTNMHRVLVLSARHRAKKYGLEFNLTREWAEKIWTGRCSVTGVELVVSEGRLGSEPSQGPGPSSSTIDRIDNNKGYTTDNCRFVCNAFNMFKGRMLDAEVLQLAKLIVKGLEDGQT